MSHTLQVLVTVLIGVWISVIIGLVCAVAGILVSYLMEFLLIVYDRFTYYLERVKLERRLSQFRMEQELVEKTYKWKGDDLIDD